MTGGSFGPRRASLAALLVLVATALFSACGSSGSAGSGFHLGGEDASVVDATGGGGDGSGADGSMLIGGDSGDGSMSVASLYFDPPTATVKLTGSGSQSASFTLMAKYSNGATQAVQAQSLQFDRPDLAAMTAGEPVVLKASGPYAGVGTVHAIFGGQSATAQLTVQVAVTVIGPGVPPGAVTALGGGKLPPDPAVTSLLYPYDKTVFALGLTSPLVMWTAPNPADVYRLHYAEKNYTYDGYFVVPQPAQLAAAQSDWDRLTASNGGDPLTAALSRWDATTKTAYASASQSWLVAPASLSGAIYYWTVSNGGHMSRIHPGTGATPEVLLPPADGGAPPCMGCHAVSADGTTLVAAVEGEGSTDSADGRSWVSYDLPGVTQRSAPHLFGGNVAVTPDGKQTVFGTAPMHLADTKSGVEAVGSGIETFPLDPGYATLAHPVFAPDGKHFAAIESNGGWFDWTVGKMVMFDFDESKQLFSKPTGMADGATFAAPEQAVAYPSFSPDSSWLAFHVADHAGGCHDTCDATTVDTGAVWMQSTAGKAPIRLTTLTDSSPNLVDHDSSFEPTFNPIERGGYFWVVFTSMRNWGNRVTGASNCGQKRLWVAAIDKSPTSADPSHPAFFLEGQEETTMNMRGFWTLAACTPTKGGGSCKQGFECCSGFCDKGHCVDTGTISCAGIGDTCKVAADCCNSSVVVCTAGKCATPGAQ